LVLFIDEFLAKAHVLPAVADIGDSENKVEDKKGNIHDGVDGWEVKGQEVG